MNLKEIEIDVKIYDFNSGYMLFESFRQHGIETPDFIIHGDRHNCYAEKIVFAIKILLFT